MADAKHWKSTMPSWMWKKWQRHFNPSLLEDRFDERDDGDEEEEEPRVFKVGSRYWSKQPRAGSGMIQGIFFARFMTEEGIKVLHQSPPGCIVPDSTIPPHLRKPPLFDFAPMSEYILPKQAFCNRYVTSTDPENKYRILGYPVCISDNKYARNELMFNFCIVIGTEVDKIPYEAVVKRLASTFTEMEVQGEFLSREGERDDGERKGERRSIAALLEIIKEDLNNYNECMIPVDDANTINMKLFPIYAPPPPVKAWHVPISKMKFSSIVDDTWDLTLRKVIDKIDGISDVRRIAHNADVSLTLCKTALQHLLYYDSILMLDMFMFGNIYAPTTKLREFIQTPALQSECAAYVYIPGPPLSPFYLTRLFSTLCTSRTLKEWLKLHMDQGFPVLNFVDVRRFIQFGVIKGLIYRVHKYAVSNAVLVERAVEEGLIGEDARRKSRRVLNEVGERIAELADGTHCFDQITVELNMGDPKIMDQLKRFPRGDVEIIYR